MDQWEGTIISVPASKIQESLGLTDSLHDRDIWQLFLVSASIFCIYIPSFCNEEDDKEEEEDLSPGDLMVKSLVASV